MDQKKIYIYFYSLLVLYTGFFATTALQASGSDNIFDTFEKKSVPQLSTFNLQELLNLAPSRKISETQTDKAPKAALPQSIIPEYTALWDQIDEAENEGHHELAELLTEELSRVFSSGVGQIIAFPDVTTEKKSRVRTPRSSPRTEQPIREQLETTIKEKKQTRTKKLAPNFHESRFTELQILQSTPNPEIVVSLESSPCEKIEATCALVSPQLSLGSVSDEEISLSLSTSDPRYSATISEDLSTARKTSNWTRAKKLSTDFDEVRFAELKVKETS